MMKRIKLGALKSNNFRWYFFGIGISLCGSWLQYIALGWFIYHLTDSPTLLGFSSLIGTIPLLLFPTFFGHLIDRIDNRKLLITTQSLSFFQALLLSIMTLSHTITYPLILLFSLIQGVIFSLDQPLRQTLIPQLITNKEDLPNAIAWNAFLNNFARVISPIIAGFIISRWNEGICFLLDSFSFLIMIFAISRIKWNLKKTYISKSPFWKTWRLGLTYIKKHNIIIQSLILTFITSSTLGTYTMFMPIITKTIYEGNSTHQGYLLAASGIGAVIASLFMTSQKPSIKLTVNKIIIGSIFGALSLTTLINFHLLLLGCFAMCLLGGSMITIFISLNSMIQMTVEEDYRGKVMSFYTIAFLGATPLSNFITGYLIEQTNIQMTMSGLCAIFIIGIIHFYFKIRKQASHI